MSYGLDFRKKVISYYEENGGSQRKAAKIFGINISTIKRWLSKVRKGENLDAQYQNCGRQHKIDEAQVEEIRVLVEADPSITLQELCAHFAKEYKQNVGLSTMCRVLKRLNLRRKKMQRTSPEKDTERVKKNRRISSRN